MLEEEITNQDMEILNDIIANNHDIRTLYKKLLFMEITDNKNTANYNQTFDSLKRRLELEKQYYNRLNLTPVRARSIMRCLIQSSDGYHEEDNNVLEVIFNPYLDELEFYRILQKLENYGNQNDDIFVQYLKGDPMVVNHQDLKSFIISNRIRQAANIDFEKAFIYYNEEAIKANSDDDDFIDKFTSMKYGLSFLSSNVEEFLISNKFEVNQDLYFGLNFHTDIMRISKKDMDEIQLNLGYEYCYRAINEMFCSDIEIEELGLELDNTIWASYLKAGASFLFSSSYGMDGINQLKKSVFDANDAICNQASNMVDYIYDCLDEAQEKNKNFKYLSLVKK